MGMGATATASGTGRTEARGSATVMHEALNLLLEGQSLNYLSKMIPKYRLGLGCKVAK